MEKSFTKDATAASVVRGSSTVEGMEVAGFYTVECIGSDGVAKWCDEYDNLVATQGKNHLLDNGLAGPASAVSVRMSLITSGTPVAGDTYATHAGFVELAISVVAFRGTPVFSVASAGVKQTSAAVSFSVVGTGTITGSAINVVVGTVGTLGTVGDTATSGGVLYSAGLFAAAKSVTSGDTLNVTYSTTLT
jgi:hypothetical protein